MSEQKTDHTSCQSECIQSPENWTPAVGALEPSIHAPVYTFTITRKGGALEEVNSCFVEFTQHHVIFRDSEGRIDYGLHASELIDIVQADHS